MRTTCALAYRHAKYYYFAPSFKWGLPKHKDPGPKYWRRALILNRNMRVIDDSTRTLAELPAGYQIFDPKALTKEDFMEQKPFYIRDMPWPFNKPSPPYTRQAADYKEQMILKYERSTVMLEGYKGAMNFTNTVLESDGDLPDRILQLESQLPDQLPQTLLQQLDRRLDWSQETDGYNKKMKRVYEFPKMNKVPPAKFGPHPERVEFNTLNAYYDIADTLATRLDGQVNRRKLLFPTLGLAFTRDEKKLLMDLSCDFVTLTPQQSLLNALSTELPASQTIKQANTLRQISPERPLPLFSEDAKLQTATKQLVDISPINWEICFEKTNYYPDNEPINHTIPDGADVQTIFLTCNYQPLKQFPDRYIKGRALMYMYGYAVRQARQLYGNLADYKLSSNYSVLPKPISIQCVYTNQTKQNIGFACFQLNTTAFGQSGQSNDVKNQAWFDQMYDLNDREQIVRRIAALQLNGFQIDN